MRRASRAAALGGGVCALIASGTYGAGAEELVANRALWRAAGISHYEYSYQRACECHPDQEADTIISVVDGRVVGVRYAREGYLEEVALPPEKLSWYRTIDELFALVETAQASAVTVLVEFDPKLGYPVSVYVDYVEDLVGDELGLEITSFTPAD